MTTTPHDPEGGPGEPSITRADMIEWLRDHRPRGGIGNAVSRAVIDAIIKFIDDHGRGAHG